MNGKSAHKKVAPHKHKHNADNADEVDVADEIFARYQMANNNSSSSSTYL